MEAKHVRDLMEAYSSVYVQPEETIDEDLQATVDTVTKKLQTGLQKLGMPINRTPRGTVTASQQSQNIRRNVKENLFDVIKGHLLDEGYADTEEAALAIMANMSEEWKQNILEQSAVAARTIKAVENQRSGYLGDDHALNQLHNAAEGSMKKLNRRGGPVVTPGLPGV